MPWEPGFTTLHAHRSLPFHKHYHSAHLLDVAGRKITLSLPQSCFYAYDETESPSYCISTQRFCSLCGLWEKCEGLPPAYPGDFILLGAGRTQLSPSNLELGFESRVSVAGFYRLFLHLSFNWVKMIYKDM